jgi:hypothetical protein
MAGDAHFQHLAAPAFGIAARENLQNLRQRPAISSDAVMVKIVNKVGTETNAVSSTWMNLVPLRTRSEPAQSELKRSTSPPLARPRPGYDREQNRLWWNRAVRMARKGASRFPRLPSKSPATAP